MIKHFRALWTPFAPLHLALMAIFILLWMALFFPRFDVSLVRSELKSRCIQWDCLAISFRTIPLLAVDVVVCGRAMDDANKKS